MLGTLLEFGEDDIDALSELTRDYPRMDYLTRIREGRLVRPAYAHAYHFEKQTLERVFANYREIAAAAPTLSPKLKLMIYKHPFRQDPMSEPWLWPWSAFLRCDYRGKTFGFPFLSASGLIMKQNLPVATKRRHLEYSFFPLIRETNLMLMFTVQPGSTTHSLMMEYEGRGPFDCQSAPLSDGKIFVAYRFARTTEDLTVFLEPEFKRIQDRVAAPWFLPPDHKASSGHIEVALPTFAHLSGD